MERDIDQYTEIWQLQDGIMTIVNACGYGVWDLHPERYGLRLELDLHLDDDAMSRLCSHMPLPADYEGEGNKGTVITIYMA